VNLHVGQYIAIRAHLDGQDVVRYYSPISRTTDHGIIQLLVKCEDNGNMSRHLAGLQPGQTVDFAGPLGEANLDPHLYKKMGLVAGGAGVSAILQVQSTTAADCSNK